MTTLRELIAPARGLTESRAEYVTRRKRANQGIKLYLQRGTPATHANNRREYGRKVHGAGIRPDRYVVGPHRTHVPHKVEVKGMRMNAAGVPEPYTWSMLHPGTLRRALA